MSTLSTEEILALAADGTLLLAIFSGENQRSDEAFVLALSEAHNTGKINVLNLFTAEALKPYDGFTFYRGQKVFRALIHNLRTSAQLLISTIDVVMNAPGNEHARHPPLEEVLSWCGGDSARPVELLELIDQHIPYAQKYLSTAIISGAAVDPIHFINRAYGFLLDGSKEQKLAAIYALSQVSLDSSSDWDRLGDALIALISSEHSDETISAAVIGAVVRCLPKAPQASVDTLSEIAIYATKSRSEEVLNSCAYALAFNLTDLNSSLVTGFLTALEAVYLENRGPIDLVDLALKQLLEAGESELARRFVEQAIRHNKGNFTLQQFDSLCHALHTMDGDAIQDWVVTWLREGDIWLCNELRDSFFGPSFENAALEINFDRFSLREVEYGYLARKAIGTFFIRPVILASFLVSLLRSAPSDAASEIAQLLFDPVLLNYSGSAREYLLPIAADTNDLVAPGVQNILDELSIYIDGLQSIGLVKELHPSEREQQLEAHRHADNMAMVMQEAEKKSFFASMFSKKILLHGNASVSWIYGLDQGPRRIETPLASIGHSYEMPRAGVVDPVGLELMLFTYRFERPPV